MKKDRDMMYYGMSGYAQGMSPMMPPIPYQQQMPNNNYNTQNDLDNRLSRIERQIRRLDNRISKLENPYPETPNYQTTNTLNQSFTPDDSMYMM